MCGIVGGIAPGGNIIPTILQSICQLKNRGYDSTGISYVNQGIQTVHTLKEDLIVTDTSSIGIAHTRWATHGKTTLENAHPVSDMTGRFSLVHNGIIENFLDFRDLLLEHGYTFKGQTDSELVVNTIHHLTTTLSLDQTLIYLTERMRGSWAILLLDSTDPSEIHFLKNGNPLLYGRGEGIHMFASELSGFSSQITEYTQISDTDIGKLTSEGLQSSFSYQYLSCPTIQHQLTPDPYPFWMLKEIHEQPQSTQRCLDLIRYPDIPWNYQHLILIGCGTSYNAAQFGSFYFKRLLPQTIVSAIDGADFESFDIRTEIPTCAIVLSQSGETKDLFGPVAILKRLNVTLVGCINVVGSKLSQDMDQCIYLNAGRENAVASTKSFLNQILCLSMMAYRWGKTKIPRSLVQLPACLQSILDSLNVESIALYLAHRQSCFILGYGCLKWIAHEASLKIKEIAYIHAEGYSVTSLKHGPFAILTPDTPVVFIVSDDHTFLKIQSIIEEVMARGAPVILVTNRLIVNEKYKFILYLDVDNDTFPLVSILPFQLLSYQIAIIKEYSPDYPRNLAKVVTV